MSTLYPNDVEDALFMQDGSPWYMSPDMWLGTAGPPGVLTAEQGPNTVNVRARKNERSIDVAAFEFSKAEIYVGNPSLYMSPSLNTVLIGSRLFPNANFPAGGGTQVKQLTWNVPATTPSTDHPNAPGHRCLIARLFPVPSSLPATFQVVAEQHEAQLNIGIAAADDGEGGAGGAGGADTGAPGGPPMGPGEDSLWTFGIDTATPFIEEPQRVTWTVTWLERLPEKLIEGVMPVLDKVGFAEFASDPPEKVMLDLDVRQPEWCEGLERKRREAPAARLLDEGGGGKALVEHVVELQPQRVARVGFKMELHSLKPGQGTVLQVEQRDENGEPQGAYGLMLVKQG